MNSKPKRKLLLIGWDSADWKIINKITATDGLPGIQALKKGGTFGNLATLEPQLSPMLWTSIATGKMAYEHGVHGFTEVDPLTGRVGPVSASSRKALAIWEMLEQRGKKCHLVSWFASQGERMKRGRMVSNMFNHVGNVDPRQSPQNWPAPPPGTYWPENLGDEMNEMRLSASEIDESILAPFINKGHNIKQDKDRRLLQLRKQLAEAFSAHQAALHIMRSDPDWDFMGVYYRAIDEISHIFMKFYPPQMEGVKDEDFITYKDVIEATYRVHDMMLSNLIREAGPDTTILLVSDHGFHSDHLRPAFTPRVPAGITVWHRDQGVLLAKGPGIASEGDALLGASLLDITPTILNFFGLPVGEDMEGRVLSEILSEAPPISTIPSWERTVEESLEGPDEGHTSLSAGDSEELLQQFVDLGYIDPSSLDKDVAAQKTIRENKWNLARACIFGSRHEQALSLLEDCVHEEPERQDFAQVLAQTQLELGLVDEANATLANVVESFGSHFGARLLQARIAQLQGDSKLAEQLLSEIDAGDQQHPQLLELSCQVYLSLKSFTRAEEAAQALLALDRDHYLATVTMGRIHYSRKEYSLARDFALEAIRLQFGRPAAHALLGRANEGLNELEAACIAFGNCLKLQPDHPTASQHLAKLFRLKGRLEEAAALDAKVLNLKAARDQKKKEKLETLKLEVKRRRSAREQESSVELAAHESNPAKKDISKAAEQKTLTLVSGLPRSGTSLMMQMLAAAGLAPMTDGARVPDEDNPKGYYEWEKIKQIRKDPALIAEAEGKVVKVITALIPHLSNRFRYRVILMERSVEEVVASQKRMIERKGKELRAQREHLIKSQEVHYQQIKGALLASPMAEVLVVRYADLITSPEETSRLVADFLGEALPNPEALAGPIDPLLYRNKQSAAMSLTEA